MRAHHTDVDLVNEHDVDELNDVALDARRLLPPDSLELPDNDGDRVDRLCLGNGSIFECLDRTSNVEKLDVVLVRVLEPPLVLGKGTELELKKDEKTSQLKKRKEKKRLERNGTCRSGEVEKAEVDGSGCGLEGGEEIIMRWLEEPVVDVRG